MNVRKSMFQKPRNYESNVMSLQNGIYRDLSGMPVQISPRRSSQIPSSNASGITGITGMTTMTRDLDGSSTPSFDAEAIVLRDFERKEEKLFPGCTYHGTWNRLGFNGTGSYKFADGTVYDGQFKDGHFHGSGTLSMPNDITLKGNWTHGVSTSLDLQFPDGLAYRRENWGYCTGPDKRFINDEVKHLAPIGEHQRLPRRMDHPIPAGCYNTGDGFYNPKTKCLYSYTDPERIVRIPTAREEKWIIKNCPTAWDEMSTSTDNHLCKVDYKEKDTTEFML